MKLKLDEKGNVVVQDGKPVYTKEDGTDIAFDVMQAMQSNATLRRENQTVREAKETAEATLAKFKGIDDPAKALDALDKLSKIDQKQLVDSKGIDALRAQMSETHQRELKGVRDEFSPVIKERDDLRTQLHSEKIGNAFATSQFVKDKIAAPIDMVQQFFGASFKVEDGKIVAYKGSEKVLSPSKMFAEPASFDEALSILVDSYPNKNLILKGSGAAGGGSGGSGNGNGGKARYTRSEYDTFDPAKQGQIARDIKAGKVEPLVD